MNERFAKLILDHLIERGVRRFCIAPGSRSTPLVHAIAKDERADAFVHFDERGCAYHAFGFAKGSKDPAVVVVTSGTAVGNLLPAIMEAHEERIPLIIITADRPPELRDAGANQTTPQVKIFSDFVRWQVDLPCPDSAIPESYIGSSIAQAIYKATRTPQGPVHINCMFREPFFTGEDLTHQQSTHYEQIHSTLSVHAVEQWAKALNTAEKGVIIAGSLQTTRPLKSIIQLAEHLHWPILPDVLSGFRSEGFLHNAIPYYDAILKIIPDLNPDFILHVGDRIVSTTLSRWLAKSTPKTYLMVADHPNRHDPNHKLTHRIESDPTLFCEQLLPFVARKSSWLDTWKTASDTIENHIDHAAGGLTEPGLMRFLHHHLPPHFGLFLANSMPIRDADQFFFPRFFRGPIFGKRGVSGIDGNIATAIGLAEGAQRPILAVLGDLTALHDLNSLAQLIKAKHPVIFLIINNRGGGIFEFLPIAEKKEIFEEFFAGAHPFNFEYAAKMFHIPHAPLKDFSTLSKALKEEKSCILEMTTDRTQNVLLHHSIIEVLKHHLEPIHVY
jgi:2-succinyl-5-enolpyruvyl-6-hydroxy-3-cyclohexene-1-carboxylate synthase